MLNFLKQSRRFLNSKEGTCIVIGNESCDLDSASSALCLAYFYQQQDTKARSSTKSTKFLPVLNIPRRDYPLKTEVRHLFDKYEITEKMLIFRDELQTEFLACNEFILVDHHVSLFVSQCVAVFDHRPKDKNVVFPTNCEVNIELVGSCATLIAEKILNSFSDKTTNLEKFKLPFNLLRSTIILDTVNFELNAARFTVKDQQIFCSLESLLCTNEEIESREHIFENLRQARADVSTLTAAQLLRKDLKILKTENGAITIALPGFPISVRKFIEKEDAEEALNAFVLENKCDFVLLLGMFVNDNGSVERDIGLINVSKNNTLLDSIEKSLLQSKDPSLQLESYVHSGFKSGHFFKQQNIKATRKHILPIVKDTIELLQLH